MSTSAWTRLLLTQAAGTWVGKSSKCDQLRDDIRTQEVSKP